MNSSSLDVRENNSPTANIKYNSKSNNLKILDKLSDEQLIVLVRNVMNK